MLIKFAISCVLISFCFSPCVSAQSQDPPSEEDQKPRIVNRIYNDVSEKNRWEIEAAYPELRLKGDKIEEGVSRLAKTRVMGQVNEFKKEMSGFTAEDRKNLPRGVNYELSISYNIEYLGDDFVSINFGRSEYTGGAHPNHLSFTINYDLTSEKELKLTDLFKENTNFLDIISKNSIEQISEKQDEFKDIDWIREGAGPKINNFQSWNITRKGLKFSFDPYQVGPYAIGGFETIVPYQKFEFKVQSPLFYRVSTVSYINGNPPNWCRNGLFTKQNTDFSIANVKGEKNERAYFHKDDGDCPNGSNCRRTSYLITGDEVISSAEYEGFVCVWYQPKKGSETVGWIRKERLSVASNTSPNFNWIGEWSYAENTIRFIPRKIVNNYLIKGEAFWRGVGDNIHIGELDFSGTSKNGKLEAGDGTDKYDCQVKMQRIGKYLIVSDNKMCGGVNVSFDGVYVRK
jgi:hypothetical protein